ncbi:MAG TPA: response regulator [Candidatus Binataceae bacterium]|nr:response regulator [Candidatus Binataceae bacterium]
MSHNSILIVDDNESNVRLIEAVLESNELTIRTAGDAEEAAALLQTFSPDLILMDIQLPGIDGLEFARQLKSAPATQNIIIVALTAYAMKGDKEKALAAGCDGYIAKPIDTRALPDLIAGYLALVDRSEQRARWQQKVNRHDGPG